MGPKWNTLKMWMASTIELAAIVLDCDELQQDLSYEPATTAEYAERGCHTCKCLAIVETVSVTNATSPIDLGEGRTAVLPENLQMQ